MVENRAERRDPGRILGDAWRAGRLGHALLLHGPSPNALEGVAFSLASGILEARVPVVRHPDCTVVRPTNKMRQIGIAAVRDLVRTVSHSANQGGWKVVVLAEADRMNLAAANAFLKTLEEPPSDTILFLLSTRPYDLPDTIRSRCLGFKVPGEGSRVEDPDWDRWCSDFEVWLDRIETPPANKEEVAGTVLRLYGLVQRFESVLAALAEERTERVRGELPEEMGEEERIAVEAGVQRGARQDLLAAVEGRLRDWVVGRMETERSAVPTRARKLVLAVREVESTAGLLALNFNATAAIEHLFVKILRIWSRN